MNGKDQKMKQQQRGGTAVGLIIGMIVGLGVALAVAVYVTKVPVPFLNKGNARGSEQDEAQRNKNWDPNSPLYGKNPARPSVPATPVLPGGGRTPRLLARAELGSQSRFFCASTASMSALRLALRFRKGTGTFVT